MAEDQQILVKNIKMVKTQLENIANELQNLPRYSTKLYESLINFLQVFKGPLENYTPLLLTAEVVFTKLLKRGDLIEEITPLKPIDKSPEAEYTRWLRKCYEMVLSRTLELIKQGRTSSRVQALVTYCKLLQAEGQNPLETVNGYYFPAVRLKNIFSVLLDSEVSMSTVISRFQEYTEYRDVQQFGIKILSTLAYRKSPTSIYMQNYLELLDKLLVTDIITDPKKESRSRDCEDNNEKLLCGTEDKNGFQFNTITCRRHANRCWGFACQWPLYGDARTHRRALLLLVERLMPLLSRPHLATDMLCDSLDAGGAVSMLALQGVLDLVRVHNIDYPDVYERIYAMFEPEMFVTRHKARLLRLADVFLSSTHLPEGLVAAFAKRLSRLALVASPEDAVGLLQLVANLLLRHPGLKRMICYEDSQAIMCNDPYVMEETVCVRSRALGSSLWEVAALRKHFAPAVSAAAARVLRAHEQHQPPAPEHVDDNALFDDELKKRFKTIELNFIRPHGMTLPSGERLVQFWEITA